MMNLLYYYGELWNMDIYYKLNPELGFRGWSNIPYALVHLASGTIIKKLSEQNFELLQKLHNISVDDEFCKEKRVSEQLILFQIMNIIKRSEKNSHLNEEQKYKKYDCRYISEAVWAITKRCNYNCRHCSVSSPNAGRNTDLSMEECKNVIIQLEECGIKNVTLIGGEPLIHPCFKEIVLELLNHGIQLSQIFTNGSLITETLLDYFEKIGVRPVIRMSFDGVGFHDLQRGVYGAEKNLIQKLELLYKRKFPVVIDMCVNRANLESLAETVSLMDSYDVKLINITPTCDIGLWKEVAESEKLPFETYYDYLLKYIPVFFKSKSQIELNLYRILYVSGDKKRKILLPKSYSGTEKSVQKNTCPSFETSINISYDGKVSPCFVITDSQYMKRNMPSLFQEKLCSILNYSEYTKCACTKAEEIIQANECCQNCDYRFVCGGGCRAMAVCKNEDFYGYDVSNCVFFKKGYYEKMKKLLAEETL